MNTSTTITKIAQALMQAQKETGKAVKGETNPFFKSKYADLGAVMEACKDACNNNGIVILQPVGHDEHGDYVETVLMHESGEYIADKMRLISTVKPQDQGSAITYARRYALQSMLFIPAEDDDANTANANVRTNGTQVHQTASTVTIMPSKPEQCPECYATKTPYGKIFHKPTCSIGKTL